MLTCTRTGALSLAELGTMIPKSGCEYAYLFEAFGPIPAFVFSYVSMILIKPSSIAIIALTCAEYVMVPLFDDGCGVPPVLNRKLTAAVVICEYSYRHLNPTCKMYIIFAMIEFLWFIFFSRERKQSYLLNQRFICNKNADGDLNLMYIQYRCWT